MSTQAATEPRSILSVVRELPPLPATVPAPEVSYSFSVWGYLNTEVTIDGATIIFWTEAHGEIVNSDLYTGDPHPWSAFLSAEDLKAAVEWAEVMHARVTATARDFLIGLSTEDFKADLVSVARS